MKQKSTFSKLKYFAKQMLSMFENMYVWELTFSLMNYRKSKYGSQLADLHLNNVKNFYIENQTYWLMLSEFKNHISLLVFFTFYIIKILLIYNTIN